jgi:twitching motility two-component system response regulator PilH
MPTVLVVDDSPTEVHFMQSVLTKHGYEVEVANSGDEGVTKAKAVLPDLILMDVVMPGMNGFQATRQLNRSKETAGIPVIIVTTKDQETDKVWGLRQGAKDYIVKPVKESDLLATVKSVLAG